MFCCNVTIRDKGSVVIVVHGLHTKKSDIVACYSCLNINWGTNGSSSAVSNSVGSYGNSGGSSIGQNATMLH